MDDYRERALYEGLLKITDGGLLFTNDAPCPDFNMVTWLRNAEHRDDDKAVTP